jgi:hypothetical protein
MSHKHAKYDIESVTPDAVRIRDEGPWDRHPTVTNDAELVVQQLVASGYLQGKQRLLYWDSEGQMAEIVVKDGKFSGFNPLC